MKRTLLAGLGIGLTALAAGSAWATNLTLGWFVAVPVESLPSLEGTKTEEAPNPGVTKNEPSKRVRSKRELVDGIMARNIFDHTAIGVTQAPDEGDAGGEEITDLKLRLLGTMVAEPAIYSSALIARDDRDGASRGYGIGDDVADGAVIVEIEKKRVVLERNGKREVLVIDEKDAAPRKTSSASSSDDETGIASVDENKFTIPRETLDKYIGDIDALSKMGRARIHNDSSGKPDGFRLSGIRRNSLGAKLGIKTGDIVHSVNGKGLTNVKEAMDAWQTLQNESSFNFEITRRGQKQTMEYTVR